MGVINIQYFKAEQLSLITGLGFRASTDIIDTIQLSYPISRVHKENGGTFETVVQLIDIPSIDIETYGSELDRVIARNAGRIEGYDFIKSMINDDDEHIKRKASIAIYEAAYQVLGVRKRNDRCSVIFYGDPKKPDACRSSIPCLLNQALYENFKVCESIYHPYNQSNSYIIELTKEEIKT